MRNLSRHNIPAGPCCKARALAVLVTLVCGSFVLRAQTQAEKYVYSAAADTLKPVFAVSTNLLYDLAITPNVSLEFPIGKKWSIFTEYTFPWWVTKGNDRAWQAQKWDLEPRYWLSPRTAPMDVLSGHYLGLDLSAGYYDIEPHHKGWQGEFASAALEYGYAWKLGRSWRFTLALALGWMGTEYRYYEATEEDRHLLYQHTGRFNWWGPTKLGASFTYIIHYKAGRNGR